jgi:DNA anti-recombination protein RmuC
MKSIDPFPRITKKVNNINTYKLKRVMNNNQQNQNQHQNQNQNPSTQPITDTSTPIAQHMSNLAAEMKDYVAASLNKLDESTLTTFRQNVGRGEKEFVIDPLKEPETERQFTRTNIH